MTTPSSAAALLSAHPLFDRQKAKSKKMKVKELISLLESVDPETEVLCSSEDHEILDSNTGHKFRIFEVCAVEEVSGTKTRTEDGVASFIIGESELSSKHTIMEITCDL